VVDASEQAPDAFAETMRMARAAFGADDDGACKAYLEQARALQPEALDIERWSARLAWRASDWRALFAATKTFLDIRPDREMAQLNARALSNLREWPAAAEAWRRVTELRPDWAEGWFQLARAQWRSKRPYAAARSAASLRAIGDADARASAARLAVECGQMERARDLFAEMAASDPAAAEQELRSYERKSDFRGAAVAAAGLGRRDDGEPFKKVAAAIARDLLPRAAAAEREGRAAAAYLEYAAMLAVEPENILALTATERVLKFLQQSAKDQTAIGDRAAARETFVTILNLKPDDVRSLHGLAQIEMAEQHWLSAAEVWEAVLTAAPEDEKALLQRARALDRAQAFGPAVSAWRAVLHADPNNSEANLALAKLTVRMLKAAKTALEDGQAVAAADLLLQVPRQSARAAELERRLGQVLRHLHKQMRMAYKDRRFHSVVANGLAAIRIDAEHEDIQRLLAQAAMRTHDFAAAAVAWQRLAALNPALGGAARLHLARCHQRLGDADAATRVLADLLREEPSNAKAMALAKELAAAPDIVSGEP